MRPQDSVEPDTKRSKAEQEEHTLEEALFGAAAQGNTNECIRLLDLGANINWAKNYCSSKFTPLNIATDRGRKETILCLIKRGALIQEKDLIGIARRGLTELCLILLKENDLGWDALDKALDMAAKYNHPEICKELLKSGAQAIGDTLKEAARCGSTEACLVLLDAGVPVNITNEERADSDDCSVLHIAVKYKRFATAEALLKRGANPNDIGYEGTPLDLAEGNVEMADLLLAFGAKPDMEYLKLSRALEEGKIKECADLIQEGCNVNAKGGKDQRSVLQLAAAAGHREICTLLLEKGANPNSCDMSGFTPLSETATNGYTEIFLDLIQFGADYSKRYLSYTLEFQVEESLLHIAARFGQTAICRILIEQYKIWVDVERSVDKNTPLMIAVLNLQEETSSYLIEKGANLNAQDDEGRTVLVLVSDEIESDAPLYEERLSGDAQKKICKMLLESGAQINAMMKKKSVLSHLLREFHRYQKLDQEILDMTIPRALTLEQYNEETQEIEMFNNPSAAEYNNLRFKVLFILLALKKCGLVWWGLRLEILIRTEDFCAAAVTTALHRIVKYKTVAQLPNQLFKPIQDRIYANTITDIGNILKGTKHDVKEQELLHGEQIRANIERSFQLK